MERADKEVRGDPSLICLQQPCACRRRGRKFTSVLEEMDNVSLLGHNIKIYKIKTKTPIVS